MFQGFSFAWRWLHAFFLEHKTEEFNLRQTKLAFLWVEGETAFSESLEEVFKGSVMFCVVSTKDYEIISDVELTL